MKKRCVIIELYSSLDKAKEKIDEINYSKLPSELIFGVKYAVLEDDEQNYYVAMFISAFDYAMSKVLFSVAKLFGNTKAQLVLSMFKNSQSFAKRCKIIYKGDEKWDF